VLVPPPVPDPFPLGAVPAVAPFVVGVGLEPEVGGVVGGGGAAGVDAAVTTNVAGV
jgi:hypothetical protein